MQFAEEQRLRVRLDVRLAHPLAGAYPLLALAAEETKKIKLGHFVTNPGIREPTVTASAYATLHDISEGRMAMGIGRGDSSRRVVGLKPVRSPSSRRRCVMIKDLMNGRPVDWNGKELELEWGEGPPDIPLQVAGYGPRRSASRAASPTA